VNRKTNKRNAILFVLLSFSSFAFADEAKPAKKRSVINLEEMRVESGAQKPEAFFVLQKASFDFLQNMVAERTYDMLREITVVVDSDLF